MNELWRWIISYLASGSGDHCYFMIILTGKIMMMIMCVSYALAVNNRRLTGSLNILSRSSDDHLIGFLTVRSLSPRISNATGVYCPKSPPGGARGFYMIIFYLSM